MLQPPFNPTPLAGSKRGFFYIFDEDTVAERSAKRARNYGCFKPRIHPMPQGASRLGSVADDEPSYITIRILGKRRRRDGDYDHRLMNKVKVLNGRVVRRINTEVFQGVVPVYNIEKADGGGIVGLMYISPEAALKECYRRIGAARHSTSQAKKCKISTRLPIGYRQLAVA
jgi:hypothetical protein